MAGVIVPLAKAVYLCEEVDEEGGKLNLYGLFNAFRADAFPHTREEFCVFAQLSGGLGEVPVHVDIRSAADGRLVHPSERQVLRFDRRTQLVQVAFYLPGVVFPSPGVYLAELFCDNVWVADANFELLEDLP